MDAMRQEVFAVERLRELLEIPRPRDPGSIESIPFSRNDATAGSENELQVAVFGDRKCADLPLAIESSNYFANCLLNLLSPEKYYERFLAVVFANTMSMPQGLPGLRTVWRARQRRHASSQPPDIMERHPAGLRYVLDSPASINQVYADLIQ
jgi:hypothetical protein